MNYDTTVNYDTVVNVQNPLFNTFAGVTQFWTCYRATLPTLHRVSFFGFSPAPAPTHPIFFLRATPCLHPCSGLRLHKPLCVPLISLIIVLLSRLFFPTAPPCLPRMSCHHPSLLSDHCDSAYRVMVDSVDLFWGQT
jgi:hypothetical protein